MLQRTILGTVALLGLLIGSAASADDRRYYSDHHRDSDRGYYRNDPQVRLGIDVIWGGYGYAPPPRPVVWYPAPYQPYVNYGPGYGQGRWRNSGRGEGRGHRKHRHRSRHWDDCDD